MRLVTRDVELLDAEREVDAVEIIEGDRKREKMRNQEDDGERRERRSHVRRVAVGAPR